MASPSLLAASALALAALAAGTPSRALTFKDARLALRTVGVTKVFGIGSVSDPSGETILVTTGPLSVQPLTVRVFPNVQDLRSSLAKTQPPAGQYQSTKTVCNAFVGYNIMSFVNTNNPTAAERQKLDQLVAKLAVAQGRVLQYLRRRCAA